MARLMAALAAYAVLALAAAQTLTVKIPVGDHSVELRVVVWIVLAGFALLTIVHRRHAGSAGSGDE